MGVISSNTGREDPINKRLSCLCKRSTLTSHEKLLEVSRDCRHQIISNVAQQFPAELQCAWQLHIQAPGWQSERLLLLDRR